MMILFSAPDATRIIHNVDETGSFNHPEDGKMWYWLRKGRKYGLALPENFLHNRYTHIVLIEKDKVVWQWERSSNHA